MRWEYPSKLLTIGYLFLVNPRMAKLVMGIEGLDF